jgi:predicted GNAT superfamily acetyltransferase
MVQAGVTPASAAAEAAAAARRAGVTVAAVADVPRLRRVAELFTAVWQAAEPPFPHDLMRSIADAGGCVHTAWRGAGLAGASVAVFGPPATGSTCSLIAGVSPGAERGGIGLALKLTQRAWAMAAGAATMRWTFDPLLRRNAAFNIARLGATAAEYLEDFYWQIADGVNDPVTDRLAVSWYLRSPLPGSRRPAVSASGPGPSAAASSGPGQPAILAPGRGAEPVVTARPAGSPPALLCWIPEDILAVRRSDPGLAARWRLAMREALGGAMAAGYRITCLAGPSWYVLEPTGEAR